MDQMEGCLENWQNTTSVCVSEMFAEEFTNVGAKPSEARFKCLQLVMVRATT